MGKLADETLHLYNAIKEDINPFSDATQKRLISTEAGPGTGKTTFLLDVIRALYGEYVTSAAQQVYTEAKNTTIILSGSGNEAFEDEELFNLKTRNKEDLHYVNAELRVAFVAFNTPIVKEIQKKTDSIELSIGNQKRFKGKNIIVKTSHGLLFKVAEHLGLFTNSMQTDWTKGSFTMADMKTVLGALPLYVQETYPTYTKLHRDLLSMQENKTMLFNYSEAMKEIYNGYYETPMIFDKSKSFSDLFSMAEKTLNDKDKRSDSKIDLALMLGAVFSDDTLQELFSQLDDTNKKFILAKTFTTLFFKCAKQLIDKGEISIGHSFYYKNAFVKCIEDESNLIKLFSVENNPSMYFNVLFVDECQDLTPIMIHLIARYYNYAKRLGLDVSIAIVGDSKQAIYGFSQRENAFKALEKIIGQESIMTLYKNKTFRIPQAVCNFLNSVSKMLYEDPGKELISANEDKVGFVYPCLTTIEDFVKMCLTRKDSAIVVGRSNIEITLAFIQAALALKNGSEDYLKYIRIDSKVKSDFKNLITKGIDAIDDEKLKDKIKKTAKKDKVFLTDIQKMSEVYKMVPQYIRQLSDIVKNASQKEIETLFEQRSSSKYLVKFMTAHAAKGLESRHVYVLDGIHDALFPKENDFDFDTPESNDAVTKLLEELSSEPTEKEFLQKPNTINFFPAEEEANIFYVAASRVIDGGLFLGPRLLESMTQHIKLESENLSVQTYAKEIEMVLKNIKDEMPNLKISEKASTSNQTKMRLL